MRAQVLTVRINTGLSNTDAALASAIAAYRRSRPAGSWDVQVTSTGPLPPTANASRTLESVDLYLADAIEVGAVSLRLLLHARQHWQRQAVLSSATQCQTVLCSARQCQTVLC